MIREIESREELQEIIDENEYVVIDFFTTWCQPCKRIAPILNEYAANYDKIVFVKVNAQKKAAKNYRIEAIPTFMAFKNGHIYDTMQGADPMKLKNMIKNLLGLW
jgi:thioredoxin 1